MKYDKIHKNPTTFLVLTSISTTFFDGILPFFTDAHDKFFRWHGIKGKKFTRQHRHVIRSDSLFPTAAGQLSFILICFKNNSTHRNAMFDMTRQQCRQWIHILVEVLRMTLGEAGLFPANIMEGFKKPLNLRGGSDAVHELVNDDTEREISEPADPRLQKGYYSGKKKKYTARNAVLPVLQDSCFFCGLIVEGRMYDRRISDTYFHLRMQFSARYQLHGIVLKNAAIFQLTRKSQRKRTDQ